MLDKKIRRKLLAIQSIFPSDNEWDNCFEHGHRLRKENLLYNCLDFDWIDNYIHNQLLLSKNIFKRLTLNSFIKKHPKEYLLAIENLQKKAVRYKFEQLLKECENCTDIEFYDDVTLFLSNKLQSCFCINSFQITKLFYNRFNKIYKENLTYYKKTINKIIQTSHDKNACGQLVKDFLKSYPKEKQGYYGTPIINENHINYHLHNIKWLRGYFHSKIDTSLLYKKVNLTKFLHSDEFNIIVDDYANNLIEQSIEKCYISEHNFSSIDTDLPLEQSVKNFTKKIHDYLEDHYFMPSNYIDEKLTDKKALICEVCEKHYKHNPKYKLPSSTSGKLEDFIKNM